MSELAGGCSCRAVRYRLSSEPMFVNCCHCLDCQRQTGSAFVLNALIEADRVTVEGAEPVGVTVPTDSGRPHTIFRCPTCQVALWSVYGGRAQVRFLRVGTLDDPTAVRPGAFIFTRSKQPWVVVPEGMPVFEGYYDAPTLWPAASLERRRALFG